MSKKSSVGHTWEDVRKEIFSKEEISKSYLRVKNISECSDYTEYRKNMLDDTSVKGLSSKAMESIS